MNTTCWTLVEAAGRGGQRERAIFASSYLGIIRAYLLARWRKSNFLQWTDDAVQEVFVECLRLDGPLSRADRRRPGGFRPFLFGIVRNVARRFEQALFARRKATEKIADLDALAADDGRLSQVFDRAWAESMMRLAAERQVELARQSGEQALRRVELLRLRFREELPIREISRRWNQDPAYLHREYVKARKEFKQALQDTVAFHHGGYPADVESECRRLLGMLQ